MSFKISIIQVKDEECEVGISPVSSLAQTPKAECAARGSRSSSNSVMTPSSGTVMWGPYLRFIRGSLSQKGWLEVRSGFSIGPHIKYSGALRWNRGGLWWEKHRLWNQKVDVEIPQPPHLAMWLWLTFSEFHWKMEFGEGKVWRPFVTAWSQESNDIMYLKELHGVVRLKL